MSMPIEQFAQIEQQNKTEQSTTSEPTTLEFTGSIIQLYYPKPGQPNTGFSAGILELDECDRAGQHMRFSGKIAVKLGQSVIFTGHMVNDKKYGPGLEVESMRLNESLSLNGLVRYLANHPDLKGIGKSRAGIIVSTYKENFAEILLNTPERITAEIKGMTPEIVANLKEVWIRDKEINQAASALAAYELTHHQIETLLKKYGSSVVLMVETNPYMLIGEIERFGFKRVDQIALKCGIKPDAPTRLRAGILATIAESIDDGHTWIYYHQLLDNAMKLLFIDDMQVMEKLEVELQELIRLEKVIAINNIAKNDDLMIALPGIYEQEIYIAETLKEQFGTNIHFKAECEDLQAWLNSEASDHMTEQQYIDELIERQLNKYPELIGIVDRLNENQREAAHTAITNNISVISGGAGVGKTFTVAAIVKLYQSRKKSVALCAPFGKAAKRISQLMAEYNIYTYSPSSTIHRLLESNGSGFQRHDKNPLDEDLIIMDEFSTCEIPLFYALLQAIDFSRTTLLLVGDHNQLAPVGVGNILRDIVNANASGHPIIPITVLTQVVRQAGQLKQNSIDVLSGIVAETAKKPDINPRTNKSYTAFPWYKVAHFSDDKSNVANTSTKQIRDFIDVVYNQWLQEKMSFNILTDVQMITPVHKGDLGTRELNILIQGIVQKKFFNVTCAKVEPEKKPKLYKGDKVINKKNNYDLGIMNGDMGFLEEIDYDNQEYIFQFDGMNKKTVIKFDQKNILLYIELGYVLTIHSVQGSEFPCAIIILHKSHSKMMHHRNLVYTAVTRASQTVIILGDRWAIDNSVSKEKMVVDKRRTFMMLWEELQKGDLSRHVPVMDIDSIKSDVINSIIAIGNIVENESEPF